jgi:single-strand DNA-binding protein
MSFEIQGILHKKYDTESKTASFQTRDLVLMTEENYPQYIKFQLTQERCGALDGYEEGEKIKVHFDLRGREWQGKFLTNLNAWKLEKVSGTSAPTPPQEKSVSNFDTFESISDDMPDFGDLPF